MSSQANLGNAEGAPIDLPSSPPARPRGMRKRLKHIGKWILGIILVIYLVVWWTSLRIEQRPVWPPPPDASGPAEAMTTTAEFLARDNPSLDDLGIPLASASIANPEFYLDGTRFFPAMLEDIRQATESIHMQMFGIRPGEVSDEFVAAMTERSRAGVEVRLIVDRYGSDVENTSAPLIAELEDAGVEIVTNDVIPLDRDGTLDDLSIDWRHDELGQVDHRKTMVIDGQIGWIGGAGLEDHFQDGSYTDVFMRFEGDAVLQLQLVFLTSFDVLGGELPSSTTDLAPYFPTPAVAGGSDSWLVQNLTDGYLAGTQATREMIRGATERLDIMNPYLTDPGIVDDIIAAAERGVKVRLVVSRDSNVTQATDALESRYGDLLAAGVEIWEHPGTMHAKVTVADDKVMVGTINYDAWGLYRNLEIAMLIDDPVVADDAVAQMVAPSIANSTAGVDDFSTLESVRNWIWARLTYFL